MHIEHHVTMRSPLPSKGGEITALVDVRQPATRRRLAEALTFAFDIRPGVQLPFVLGHGECETNEQALQAWILDQLGEDQWVEPGHVFNALASRLQRAIDRWRTLS